MKLLPIWTILALTTSIYAAGEQSQLIKFLQPNNVEDSYEFATDRYNCTRECVKGDQRICYYQFNAENYVTLNNACLNCTITGQSCDLPQCVTADGYERGILTINRRLPGPSIQVCEGDRIVVDVINKMSGRSITIHWHGLFQKGTPYFDGVPMVTQCPIFEDNIFRYDFIAKQPGTFYWHTHDGIQKVDGLLGSIVIRRPKEDDPNEHLYDEDLPAHVMMIMDWSHRSSDDHLPGLMVEPIAYKTSFLINGRGQYKDPETGIQTNTPYTVFRVSQGKRYRFRFIGALCDNSHPAVRVEGHRLTLIATDGIAVKPVDVDYMQISSGERYDFVLNATQEIKSYWIEVRDLRCNNSFTCNKNQLAILQYEGADDLQPATVVQDLTDSTITGVNLNPTNSTCNGTGICVAELEAIEDFNQEVLNPTPDVSFAMNIGYYYPSIQEVYQSNTYHRYAYLAQELSPYVNNIIYTEASSPLLSQRNDIPPETFCPLDDDGFPYCDQDICRCNHVLKVPLNALVQVIIIDKSIGGGLNHAIHLHGFAFNVMAMGYLRDMNNSAERIEELMKNKNFTKSPAPVLKDTVNVPSSGYTVIRFIADNPGYWFFHCHFIYHHVTGMALVLQVGDTDEQSTVPANFPKCGNFLPPVHFDNVGKNDINDETP